VWGGGADLLGAGEVVGGGRAAGQDALHGGLLGVAGGQPGGRVHAGDAEQEQVRGHRLGGGRGYRAAGHRGVPEQPPAEDEHVGGGTAEQRGGDRGAVRDHRAGPVRRQRADHGQRGRAAVEDHGGAGGDQ